VDASSGGGSSSSCEQQQQQRADTHGQVARAPSTWDVTEVCAWMESAALGKHVPLWQMCGMDGALTLALSRQQLLVTPPRPCSVSCETLCVLRGARICPIESLPRRLSDGECGEAAHCAQPLRLVVSSLVALTNLKPLGRAG
jgi:hypothetical protein